MFYLVGTLPSSITLYLKGIYKDFRFPAYTGSNPTRRDPFRSPSYKFHNDILLMNVYETIIISLVMSVVL